MIGYRIGTIAGAYGALFLFGFLYNFLVSWLERRGYDEGYTALLVIGGVVFTLAGVAVVDWRAALLAFGAFAASGVWMTVGSIARYVKQRRSGQQSQRDEVL